jgi:signal transduction histidine kinase
MKNLFFIAWEGLQKVSTFETDSPGERRRKLTLVIVAVFCCLTAVLSIINSIINSRPLIDIFNPLIFLTIVGIAMFIYFLTKRFSILLYPFLFTVLFIPVSFQMSTGGFSGQTSVWIIIWAILAPFGALMFLNVRKATWWFVAYLFLVLLSLSLDEYFTRFAEFPISFSELNVSHTQLIFDNGFGIIVLSITIFFSMRYFVNAFQREHNRAEKLVEDLTNTNQELEATLTELKETQTELVQSEKMASLGKLAAGLAHEINNPIGALKSTAGTSKHCVSKMEQFFEEHEGYNELKSDAKFQNFFQILKDNSHVFETVSERVGQTVNNFINFARLDKAGFDRVDIHQAIDNTLSLIQHELKAQTMVVKEYGEIPKVACYPGELNQLFMNLLTNAAKAIEGEGKIIIRTSMEQEKVHVQIIDSGVGIPQDQLPGLFDPSFTKDSSRVRAGLGLFASYNIVKKHRGEIKVESEIGKGTVFTIILPKDLEDTKNG